MVKVTGIEYMIIAGIPESQRLERWYQDTKYSMIFTRNTSVLRLQVTSQILRTRSSLFRDRGGDHSLTRWPPRTGFIVHSAKSSPKFAFGFEN